MLSEKELVDQLEVLLSNLIPVCRKKDCLLSSFTYSFRCINTMHNHNKKEKCGDVGMSEGYVFCQ